MLPKKKSLLEKPARDDGEQGKSITKRGESSARVRHGSAGPSGTSGDKEPLRRSARLRAHKI